MAYIDLTRGSLTSAHQNTLCLDKEECRVLLPFFKKALEGVVKKYNRYDDIHQSGESTEKQQTLLVEYSNQLERVSGVVEIIEDWLKPKITR